MIKKYENQIKELKYNVYKIGWFMRGFITYTDAMHVISSEDLTIFNDIIKENMDITKETKLPFI